MSNFTAGTIIGTGIDLVKVERIERVLTRRPSFVKRVFTDGELSYCMTKRRPAEHLAARFGVKEAVMKAFGTGWTGGIRWTDAEVLRGESGRPEVRLTGRLRELADEMGVSAAHVSFSHDGGYAVAQVVLTGA